MLEIFKNKYKDQGWDSLLLDKARYFAVLDRIADKKTSSQFFREKDELTMRWVLSNRKRFVNFMIRELKSKQNLELSPTRRSEVLSDKKRVFFISPTAEKILLMVCADILTEALEDRLPVNVYSFRRGMGNHQALFNLKEYVRLQKGKNVYILKRDVSSYGDSIDRDLAKDMLEGFAGYKDSELYKKIAKQALDIKYMQDGEVCLLEKGIPSGSPMTPPMENLYLGDLDESLTQFKNSWYGRFGDDFVFATTDLETANLANQKINNVVANLKLMIKPSKKVNITLTKNTCAQVDTNFPKAVRFEWLGHSIQAVANVGIKHKHYLESKSMLDKEIRYLIMRLAKFELTQEQRLAALKKGLEEILDLKKPTKFAACVHRNFNPTILKELDKSVAHITTRAMRTHWRMKKSSAWKLYKQVKARSIFGRWLEAKNYCKPRERSNHAA